MTIDSIALDIGDAEVKTEDGPPGLSSIQAVQSNTDAETEAGRAFIDVTEQFRAGELAPVYSSHDAGDETSTKWVPIPVNTPGPTVLSGYNRATIQRRHSFDELISPGIFTGPVSSVWTKVTPNRDIVNHLIGLCFTWEFPLFTMLSQDLFLRDYYQGSRAFCSPALVNAIASLATRYMQPDQASSAGDLDAPGDMFFREAMGLLVRESQVSNLPSGASWERQRRKDSYRPSSRNASWHMTPLWRF